RTACIWPLLPVILMRVAACPTGIGTDSAMCGGDEVQQKPGGVPCEGLARFLEGLAQRAVAAKQEMIEAFEFQALITRHAGTPQADNIQAADAIIASRDAERWQVFADSRSALHQGQCSDAHKLVDQTIAGDE